MEYIQIPAPDFSFSEIAKSEAQKIIQNKMHVVAMFGYMQGFKIDVLEGYVISAFDRLSSKEDKLIFLSELLNYLNNHLDESNITHSQTSLPRYLDGVNKFKYFLYSQAISIGYSFDKNAFTSEETTSLNIKLNDIIDALSQLQAGQDVVFNHIEDIKSDFESLKSDYLLGKKRWYQRAGGIVLSYAGTKGADEMYDALRPYLKKLLQQAPQLIEGVLKVLS